MDVDDGEEAADAEAGGSGGSHTFGQWQLARLDAESRDARGAMPTAGAVAYLTQLYFTSRFASHKSATYLEPEMRFEQLVAVAVHFLRHPPSLSRAATASRERPRYLKAPAARGGEAGAPPAENRWAWETDAHGAPMMLRVVAGAERAPSRRRAGATSPTSMLTPGRRRSAGASYTSIGQLELYEEATAHLQVVLLQLAADDRARRCLDELEAMHAVAGKELRGVPTDKRLSHAPTWSAHAQRVLRSPHLQAQMARVLAKLEEVCGAILERLPGEPFDERHALDAVVDVLLNEAPAVADFLQVTWGLRLTARNPLGYLRRTRAVAPKAKGRRGVRAAPAPGAAASSAAASGSDASRAAEAVGASDDEASSFLPVQVLLDAAAAAAMRDAEAAASQPTQPTQGGAVSALLDLARGFFGAAVGSTSGAGRFSDSDDSDDERPTARATAAGSSGSLSRPNDDDPRCTSAARMPSDERCTNPRALRRRAHCAVSLEASVPTSNTQEQEARAHGSSAPPPCAVCLSRVHPTGGALLACQRCREAAVHEQCCHGAVAALGLEQLVTALCPTCVDALREAQALEDDAPPPTTARAFDTLVADASASLLKAVQRAGQPVPRRGSEEAAAVYETWAAMLDGAVDDACNSAAGLAADARAEGAALATELRVFGAAELLRGSTPDADAAEAALGQLQVDDDVQVAALDATRAAIRAVRAGRTLDTRDGSSVLRRLRVRDLEGRVRRFARGALADALGLEPPTADVDAEADADADASDDEEAVARDGGGRGGRWRDRRQRLALAVFSLAMNAMVGNQEALPQYKMLTRLVSKFMFEPEPLARLRGRMCQAGARGPEQRWLRRRTVVLQHGARAVAARAELDLVQSSDNASFFRMVAPGLGVTERVMLCSWTALGEWHLHSAGGLDAAGRERSRVVGSYLVTGGAYATAVFPTRSVGALSCTHLDPSMRLPADPAVLAALVPFDGTVAHAALLAPLAVNSTKAPTMLTATSGVGTLELGISEEWAAALQALVYDYGALNDVSTLVLARRSRRFARRPDGAPPGGFEAGDPESLVAHSQRVHAAQWNDDRTAVHAARIHPTAPLPEDSLSSAGQLAIVIEEWLRHGQFHPGYFALTAQGDGHRVFHQGDVGTEKVTLGLLRRARQRVLAAVVDESDPRSAKFETEAAARAAVDVLAALAVPDHLHAPLHNGMALVKGFLVPHWKIASLDQLKTLLGFSGIRPSKEGEGYRLKQRLLKIHMLAYNQVLLRRFHTNPECIGRVRRTADGALDEVDYFARVRAPTLAHKSRQIPTRTRI